jgi:hypothetical protein
VGCAPPHRMVCHGCVRVVTVAVTISVSPPHLQQVDPRGAVGLALGLQRQRARGAHHPAHTRTRSYTHTRTRSYTHTHTHTVIHRLSQPVSQVCIPVPVRRTPHAHTPRCPPLRVFRATAPPSLPAWPSASATPVLTSPEAKPQLRVRFIVQLDGGGEQVDARGCE